jgi:hypothetical protein
MTLVVVDRMLGLLVIREVHPTLGLGLRVRLIR